MGYEVYLYTIPKVSEDGKKSIPGPESKRQEFTNVEGAKSFASEHKDKFDRVVLIESGEEGQRLLERYIDGEQA